MCGIVGRVTRQPPGGLDRALAAIAHRGPDATMQAIFDCGGATVELGHTRLSILDLSAAANQPFTSASGRHVIVFNGEIYNHGELRSEMREGGTLFRTRSDTEVLVNGYEREGLAILRRLDGMFAFGILDLAHQRLVLARDPFGIKPMYFTRLEGGGVAFASEIRALSIAANQRAEPDPGCLAEFLLNGFLYEPHSGYNNVEKVPPGHFVQIDLPTFRLTVQRYFDVAPPTMAVSNFKTAIDSELSLQVEADVPVGIFFSGGIDSSALAAAAPRSVDAFFVDYGQSANSDGTYVQQIADSLGLRLRVSSHREQETSVDIVLDEFQQVAVGTEEPISDYTYLATRLISRAARNAGFKVMLSGMGGDELFAGYPRYAAARRWLAFRRLRLPVTLGARLLRCTPSWSKRADRLASFALSENFEQAYTSLIGYFSAREVCELLGTKVPVEDFYHRLARLAEPVSGQSPLRKAMFLDRHGFLPHNLTVTDRASMAEHIEVRVPLLSPAVDALASAMPESDLIGADGAKLPLRRYLKHHLSEQLLTQPKRAFNPPLDGRIRLIGKQRCEALLLCGPLRDHLHTAPMLRWIDEHYRGIRNHTYRLWQLLYLQLWLNSGSAATR